MAPDNAILMHPPPDPNAVALMFGEVDVLPKAVRALVHEFGLRNVQSLMEEHRNVEDLRHALIMHRAMKQAEWLATDYVTPDRAKAMRRRVAA